ncbi:2-octaprenyl-6-methoxyphenyl hydroxylase [Spiribacter sp. 221]|uniref:2-octaprenyl-6-methoxyphenyl hydroxylase n=1 Tax=Spiribacter onubensis TaxID=3122420 RepID=UPI00349F3A6C
MMVDEATFDILIAGGGLVGASLAVALRDSGLTVAVVEPVPPKADQQPSFDDRQTALAPTSRRFFQNLGLWDAIEPGVAPIRYIHVSDRGHGGFTRLNADEEGLPALGHVAPNRVLGAALRPAMAAAATLFCPAHIVDSQPVYDGAAAGEARLAARKVRIETEDGERTLTTRLLVVADGMRSATRDALGIETDERDYGQSAIIANLRTERSHAGVAFERFTPDGPLALLPASDNAVSLVWTLPHDEAREVAESWSDAAFLARLQDAFGWRLGRLEGVGQRHVYPLVAVTAEQFAVERAVILGNAAHALHPVAGQGLNLALRDVAALAEALGGGPDSAARPGPVARPGSAAERADPAPDPGEPSLLEAYARSRRSDYRRTFTFTDGLVRLFSNEFLPLVAARNIGLTALDLLPPARRLLLKQATGAAGDVPALCREP